MTTINRTTIQAQDAQILIGIKKDLPTLSNLPLAGAIYSMATLSALVQSRIDAANAVLVARANYAHAISAYKAVNVTVTPVVRGLHQYVINAYGPTGTQLADFGFVPSKRATQTPEAKAAAVAKRAATRKARGTVGPKAKLAVTGATAKLAALESQVAGIAAAPPANAPAPVSPATPSPAPQPALATGALPAATPATA
jgi:hypothetical protein